MPYRQRRALTQTLKKGVGTLGLLAGMSLTPIHGWAGDLTIEVRGVRNAQGNIIAVLYDEQQAFLAQDWMRATASVQLVAREGTTRFTIHDLNPKSYAIAVLHDENGNADLDLRDAVPTEGYAYSQGAGQFQLPSFEEARFEVTSKDAPVIIQLIYHQR